jgi:hypothetical protein
MQTNWHIMRAMLDCNYKAWLLSREQEIIDNQPITFPHEKITANDKIALTAFYILQCAYKAN